MNIAVLTLTRDRLEYTQHCFAALQEFAGCDYDHHVLDQGSDPETVHWLMDHSDDFASVMVCQENLGIPAGLNELLDRTAPEGYDVIVHFDNDCELVMPDTLRDLCELVMEGGAILSPRILGLLNPPVPTGELRIGEEIILDVPQIGGICLAAPGWWYDTYRYPTTLPKWGMDDAHICATFREAGGTCGYVKRLEAWHYEGTVGQHARYPEYFARRVLEGGPV